MAGFREKDIRRFQIAVNNTALMGILNRIGDGGNDRGDILPLGPQRIDPVLERSVRSVLHCEPQSPGIFAAFVKREDAWMLEAAERLGLDEEPSPRFAL